MGQDEIRPFDGDLTFIGKIMASLPIEIEFSRLIALGHAFGLVYETVIIAACLSTKSIFKTYYQDRIKTYKWMVFVLNSIDPSENFSFSFRSKFNFGAGNFCDFQSFLNVYKVNISFCFQIECRKRQSDEIICRHGCITNVMNNFERMKRNVVGLIFIISI